MIFTKQDEIRPLKCEGLHNHLPSPQTHLVILLHHIPLRISFPDWLTSGIPSLSEERLLSYLATATARPVKAKIEFPFTTGLSLDRERQRTIKRHDRHASSKICVSIKTSYATGALAPSNFTGLSSMYNLSYTNRYTSKSLFSCH